MNKEYLGDGVYAATNDFGQVVLTTGHDNPEIADNTIFLEPEVVTAFKRWLQLVEAAR